MNYKKALDILLVQTICFNRDNANGINCNICPNKDNCQRAGYEQKDITEAITYLIKGTE